jgi:4'-phosphopantetheinyl transferase
LEKRQVIFQSGISFSFEDEALSVGLALTPSLSDEDLRDIANHLLHPAEIKTGGSFTANIRRRSYLNGRIAAKMAIARVFPDIPSASFRITAGSFGKPGIAGLPHPYGISISHNESWNAGLCFPLSFPMGVDAETITEKNKTIIASILSAHEKELCCRDGDSAMLTHLLWTAKEAAGKAIGFGFRLPAAWYEIESIDIVAAEPKQLQRILFKSLSVFTALSAEIPGGILTIAFPAEENLGQTMEELLLGADSVCLSDHITKIRKTENVI